ncbi:MAG: hypothetical protein HXS41_05130 [Theionarchaea archaeon]|nr:hypothetical protein [Theionarchaea archaeon]MBU7001932.1 hypothetical protein [Theionarchaea archaeon]MBU7020419.1 hypothetical protein [Theionarchaea archaeon]MBU7041638.1 hypothetical protein [Theionarchaea archaeon]
MNYTAGKYPFHIRVMILIASFLSHPVYGKATGVLLMGIPLSVMLFQIVSSFSTPSLSRLLLVIPVTYGGLFLAAFLHEMGHVVVLRSMGCKTKTQLLYNYHNPLLLFNMRTEIAEDHPVHSSATFLLRRGLSGIAVNILLNVLFLALSIYYSSAFLSYLAFLQGFGSQGATSLSPTTGDSDVRTLATAIEVQDDVIVNVEEGSPISLDIVTEIHLRRAIETTYWILIEGLDVSQATHKGFLAFDVPHGIMFLMRDFEQDSLTLHLSGNAPHEMTMYTRGGRVFSIPASSKEV